MDAYLPTLAYYSVWLKMKLRFVCLCHSAESSSMLHSPAGNGSTPASQRLATLEAWLTLFPEGRRGLAVVGGVHTHIFRHE